jgi:hypothetical protein
MYVGVLLLERVLSQGTLLLGFFYFHSSSTKEVQQKTLASSLVNYLHHTCTQVGVGFQ